MFQKGMITAYPTDTSFGLGVRCDDREMLEKLYDIKQRPNNKYLSLMVKDQEMLNEYAEIPTNFDTNLFFKKPYTALLKPKKKLPQSPFWNSDKVGFRISTLKEVSQWITVPITATSANISGTPPLFTPEEIQQQWGATVHIIIPKKPLVLTNPSEIWDHTVIPKKQIR